MNPRSRRVVLVTGMSGTGKSSALAGLARRGHAVLDSDDGWLLDPPGAEPLLDLVRLGARIDEHRDGQLFIAACAANQGALSRRCDAVVLLSAPVAVLLARVQDRANPYSSTTRDRDAIAADVRQFEPVLRLAATHEIDATMPLDQVVATLEWISVA